MNCRLRLVALLIVLLAMPLVAFAQDEDADAETASTDILNMASYWRWQLALRAGGKDGQFNDLGSVAADEGWQSPDFDDAAWNRSRLGWLRELVQMQDHSGVLSLRGRFAVTDPAAAGEVRLSLEFAGGVVVYVNGREIGRSNLPGGDLKADTRAESYAAEVHRNPDSKAPAEQRTALAGRRRRDLSLKVPADTLRKGVNVLAVQVYRSDMPAGVGVKDPWQAIDVTRLQLTAMGDGVKANAGRPRGVQVWNLDINDRLTVYDYGDPNEPLRPIRLEGARNGSFCGQVILSSTDAIRKPKAVASELAQVNGSGRIPAGAFTLQFGQPNQGNRKYGAWFENLAARPGDEIAVYGVPVWQKPPRMTAAFLQVIARVRVPADAPPGDYAGSLTLSGEGIDPVAVPVQLHVTDWRVPDPGDYRTYIGFYQSPTSLALQYKVPEWSEEHWKLMEKSFAMLGRVGNQLVNVQVSDQTQFGNDEGMVYWIRQVDGTFKYDFSVFDRFMKLAVNHMPSLDHVAIHVWHSGGWETRPADQKNTVTVVDAATGQREPLQVPKFGTPEGSAFWKPVLAEIHKRLVAMGLGDAMCLGILSDGTAPQEVFTMFDEIWPGEGPAKWMRGCHRQEYSPKPYRPSRGGGLVVLHEYCYGLGYHDPNNLPPLYNRVERPGAAYHRISGHETAATLIWYRTFAEQALFRNTKGVGRVCLDFFDVVKSRHGNDWIYNRYPHSSCAQRAPSLQKIAWPGPEGAAPTTRFEAFAEGVQYAEAVIQLSEAVCTKADVLGDELVSQCKQLLADRLHYARERDQMQWAHSYAHMNHHGWQQLNRRLFELAGEVSAKLKSAGK